MKELNRMWLFIVGLLLCFSSAWALDITIDDLTLTDDLGVLIRLEADLDQTGIPLANYTVTENGEPVVLDPACADVVLRPIDIAFVIDRSFSMEDNIQAVADQIIAWIESLPANFSFQFGLTLYGQSGPPAFGCGTYAGAPRNENTLTLRDADDLVTRLQELANSFLQGGQEPAYHAIQCALQTTAWRPNSEKFIVLVSDENNDTCQWHGAIPEILVNDLIAELNAEDARFFGWINNNVACDCYDDCDRITPPNPVCSELLPYGCETGFQDFNPVALGTGGATRPLNTPFADLLSDIAFELFSTRILCYNSVCCYQNQVRTVSVTLDWNGESDTDTETFVRTNCPPALTPDIACWTGNGTTFVYGQPLTVCATVTDGDDNIDRVWAEWTFGTCTGTADAVLVDGRWCVTIPGNCTATCSPGTVIYRVEDFCSLTDQVTCNFTSTGGQITPLVCAPTNPVQFQFGVPLEVCALQQNPGDPAITSVTAVYNTGLCVLPPTVVPLGPNGYCVTIPPACLTNQEVVATFTALNICGASHTVTCVIGPPEVNLCLYDYGDLPAPYPTSDSAGCGPSHWVGSPRVWLGSSVDCDETPGSDGEGEDNGMTVNCVAQANWDNCEQITLNINVSTIPGFELPLYLSGWFDYNGDGDFTDEFTCDGVNFYSEWFIQDVNVSPGANLIPVIVNHITASNEINVRLRIDIFPFGELGFDDEDALQLPGTPPCWPRHDGEVEDYSFVCIADDECCQLCIVPEPQGLAAAPMETEEPMNLVVYYADNRIRLTWNEVPGAAYYTIQRGHPNDALTMNIVGYALAGETDWSEPYGMSGMPALQIYQVQPMELAPMVDRVLVDRGWWTMDEGSGPAADDLTPNDFDAVRWEPCPPTWGSEVDPDCDLINYMHFEGFEGHPGCAEHLRVVNDDIWYEDQFQIWTCIRIFEEPTIQTGPYYIISNNSFATMHGGFMMRIDPSWIMVNGVREYHNRLTAMVWNETLQSWMTIQSAPPQPGDPTRYSVPLNEWSEICWIVDGANSMLIIDGMVVGVGEQIFESDNNGAPLIIGAGYRHHTYPIEYPFRGDIDCLRITSLDN